MSLNINDAELGKFMELAGEVGVKVFLLHGDNWLPSVANLAALPGSGNTLGDIRQTTDTGDLYRWNGATWEIYDSNTGNILTTPTTTDTAVSSEGGLMKNIDSSAGEISQTGNGYIEDEKFGVYQQVGTSGTKSSRFTSEITRTGKKVVYFNNQLTSSYFLLNLDGTAGSSAGAQDKHIPCKPSTKYRIEGWFYILQNTSTIALGAKQFNSALANIGSGGGANLVASAGWQYTEYEFTTLSTTEYLKPKVECSSSGAGNVEEGYFDMNSIKISEITENTAASLTSTAPSIVGLTAVGSADNIDQSLDSSGAYANTYTLPVAISETATELQTFTPTKSKLSRIGVWVVAKGTGDWTLTLHDSGNVYQWASTIANASLTNGAMNYFSVPVVVIPGANYHFHLTSTVADGTAKVNTASDLETASFVQNYFKETTNFTVRQNNKEISISADKDGFLEGSRIDLVNNTFFWDSKIGATGYDTVPYYSQYSKTIGSWALTTANRLFSVTTNAYLTWKLPIALKNTYVTFGGTVSGGSTAEIQSSIDNKNWIVHSTGKFADTCKIQDGAKFVRIKSLGNNVKLALFTISGDIDSKIPVLYNYPTGKDTIQTYTKNLASATTVALYRLNKYGFPAIEYSNGEYQYLDIDTTSTGSVVAFSSNGSSYTTVTDGASIGLTSTTNPVVWVRSNITANRIFISSNDYNVSTDKRGSLRMGLVYQVKNQGLTYDMQELQKEVNELKSQEVPGMTLTTGDITTEAGSFKIIPTATGNINLIKVPKAGTRFSIIVETSGTSSYTLTFNTGFKSTGTLATGTVDAKYFTVNFISDGIQAIETSRTTAM